MQDALGSYVDGCCFVEDAASGGGNL